MKQFHRKSSIYNIFIFSIAVLIALVLIGCTGSPTVPTPTVPTALPSSTPIQTQILTSFTPTPSPSQGTPSPAVSSPSPSPPPTITPKPQMPTAIYAPTAAPLTPDTTQLELMNYVLELINKDRATDPYLLPPVTLGFNAAAQKHAQDMIDNHYQAAHWGTDGLKPYMRYTQEGGLNFDLENSCYVEASNNLDIKSDLSQFEHEMMFNDAASNWYHRDTIVNKWAKKVNIGIAYTNNALALVQDFEGDYLEYFQPPTLTGNTLSLSGRFKINNVALNNITITFDDSPQPITPDELSTNPAYHSYGLGPQIGLILPPPPPGQVYSNFPANGVLATSWEVDQSGQFSIQADIGQTLSRGKGVYTIVLVTIIGSDHFNMTNYSIFK